VVIASKYSSQDAALLAKLGRAHDWLRAIIREHMSCGHIAAEHAKTLQKF